MPCWGRLSGRSCRGTPAALRATLPWHAARHRCCRATRPTSPLQLAVRSLRHGVQCTRRAFEPRGKIPLQANYVVGRDGDDIVLRNYEGNTYRYPDPLPASEHVAVP